jgi:hypothetical protein
MLSHAPNHFINADQRYVVENLKLFIGRINLSTSVIEYTPVQIAHCKNVST